MSTSRTALIKKADLNRLAALAKSQNVRVELEFGGMIIQVSPDTPRPPVDASEESALDRELAAFEEKNGYS